MKKVSIVVPIYNEEDNIEKTVLSILSQTYKNTEIILINDGSTDDSLKVCLDLRKKHDHIIIINKENSGVSASRNEGIRNSSGDYICFIDADDTVDLDHIERLVCNLEENMVDAAFTSYKMIYDKKEIFRNYRLDNGRYQSSDLMEKFIDDGTMSGILIGSACTGIYKKDIINNNNVFFDEELAINEDGVFNIKYLLNSKYIYINNDFYTYNYKQRITGGRKYDRVKNGLLESTRHIENTFSSDINNMEEQIKKRKVSESLWLILSLCSQSNVKYRYIKDEIKEIFSHSELYENDLISVAQLSIHKKVYYYMFKYKLYKSTYILTKYITPLVTSIFKR